MVQINKGEIMDHKKLAEQILLDRFNLRYPQIVDILTLLLKGERVCDIAELYPNIKEQSIRNTKQRYKEDIEKYLNDKEKEE